MHDALVLPSSPDALSHRSQGSRKTVAPGPISAMRRDSAFRLVMCSRLLLTYRPEGPTQRAQSGFCYRL